MMGSGGPPDDRIPPLRGASSPPRMAGGRRADFSMHEDARPMDSDYPSHRKGGAHMSMDEADEYGGDDGAGLDKSFSTDAEPEETASFDKSRLQLFRKTAIKPGLINPYRFLVVLRAIATLGFYYWRVTHPHNAAYGLWITAVICEIWMGLNWMVDQFPRLWPTNRETFMDRLELKYEKPGMESGLPQVDFIISCMDPERESPVWTVNSVLSVLSLDYPVEKIACYVSDDGASMLTFQLVTEAAVFARIWVPFVKKFEIEPRAPDMYFSLNVDYLKDKKHPDFVKERRAMKHQYEEFKVRINALVAKNRTNRPLEGWKVADGTPWPGNDIHDHVGMIQILLQPDMNAVDVEGNPLPHLVYLSREKKPGYDDHRKAGAMNATIRASALITNAPYIVNMDNDSYISNSRCIKEAMCFFLDPDKGAKIAYVQFPFRFDGVDPNDRYNNHDAAFYDIYLKGVDGIQGPPCLGSGCIFKRQALYATVPGGDPEAVKKEKKRGCCMRLLCCPCSCFPCCCGKRQKKAKSDSALFNHNDEELQLMPLKWHTQRFGMCHNFVASTFETEGGVAATSPRTVLSDVILVISCGYEENTQWGKEVGWIYCSSRENLATGQLMHARGWRSIYCSPQLGGFKFPAMVNLADRLHAVLRESLGAVETFWSKRNVMWWRLCDAKFKCCQRVAYLNAAAYPLVAVPVTVYAILPAICLLANEFIVGDVNNQGAAFFVGLALTYALSSILEMRWSNIGLDEWWRAQQFWVIKCTSSYLGAVMQGSLKVFAGCEGAMNLKPHSDIDSADFAALYTFRWTWLVIAPLTVVLLNIFATVAGFAKTINDENPNWGSFFTKFIFSVLVLMVMYPFIKGLMGKHRKTPTIVIVWAMLLAIVLSLLWVQVLW